MELQRVGFHWAFACTHPHTHPHTHTSILVSQFIPPPFPFVIQQLCLCFSFVHKFICTIFSGFHTETILYRFVFSLSDWPHSIWLVSVSIYICRWHNFVLFYGWIVFCCVYKLHFLYPFLYWWTFRLLPCPDCCKSCYNEHWGACIFLSYGFLQVYAQEWTC